MARTSTPLSCLTFYALLRGALAGNQSQCISVATPWAFAEFDQTEGLELFQKRHRVLKFGEAQEEADLFSENKVDRVIGSSIAASKKEGGLMIEATTTNSTHVGEPGLYDDVEQVLTLNGTYPWQVLKQSAECPFLIIFYVSWCPHCISLKPTFERVSRKLRDHKEVVAYTMAAVDCAQWEIFCDRNNITEYPQLMVFASGKDMGERRSIFQGGGITEQGLLNQLESDNAQALTTLGLKGAHKCAEVRSKLLLFNKAAPVIPVVRIPEPERVWLKDLQRALFQSVRSAAVDYAALWSRSYVLSLKAFLDLAADAFPHKPTRLRLANEVVPALNDITKKVVEKTGQLEEGIAAVWIKNLSRLEPDKSKDGYEYFGCRGSLPFKRGYTCALWQLFHALLAHAKYDISSQKGGTHAGLMAIHGWIKTFFGCEECRKHFLQMSERMQWKKAETDDEAMLWMWRDRKSVV